MSGKGLTDEDIRAELGRRVKKAGSLRLLAGEIKCSHGYLREVLQGTRHAGPLILDYLGLERTILRRRKR